MERRRVRGAVGKRSLIMSPEYSDNSVLSVIQTFRSSDNQKTDRQSIPSFLK